MNMSSLPPGPPPTQPVVEEAVPLYQQLQLLPATVLVAKYRQLRDKVGSIKDEHSAQLKPYNDMMDAMETAALAKMQAEGIDSIKTKDGTMYQSTLRSYKVADPEAFLQWCVANDRLDMLERRAAKGPVDEFAEETQTLPPGLEASSRTGVNFRK